MPNYPIAIVALVNPDDDSHDDGAELFAFVVPHVDIEKDEILEQVAYEMNAQEREALADASPDKMLGDVALDDEWTPAKLRAEYDITIEVRVPSPFVVL